MLVAEYRMYHEGGKTYEATWGITDYDTGIFYPFGSDQQEIQQLIINIEEGHDKITRYCGTDHVSKLAQVNQPTTINNNITVNITTNGRRFKTFDNE